MDSLSSLIEHLKSLPRDPDAYHAALEGIRFGFDEFEKFVQFDTKFYTRNLIARTDDFELILLCWEPGQVTPIHDHAGSDAWVFGLDDRVEEVRYRCVAPLDGPASVERLSAARLAPGMVAHINDDMAWHTVENPTSQRACSLHFYSKPIDACNYFDPELKTIKTRTLSYTTNAG